MAFLRPTVTTTALDGRERMRDGGSAPWSLISRADRVSSSPQVNLRERDACVTWDSSCPAHGTEHFLEITSRLTRDPAATAR